MQTAIWRKRWVALFIRRTAPTGLRNCKKVLDKCIIWVYNKDVERMALKMKLEYASTKDLLYADYRYKHYDGDCDSCPCHSEDNRCSKTHDEIKKELNLRGE